MEETFTDKEFCKMWKIDRTTSLRWRDDGIVAFIKLPNGQIRYLQSHIDELRSRFERSAALQNSQGAIKGGVVNISVAKRGDN
jgi:predicted site-specific integrase-resolvase